MELLALCDIVKEDAEAVTRLILGRWREISELEPWLALPDDLDFDHLPGLIRDLAQAALCTEFEREACARALDTAAIHGEHRAEQGFGDDLIYREYHLLRRALWERISADRGETTTAFYANMRLDTIISLATGAALHGLHREELEAADRWPDILDEILDTWPLPPP